MDGRPANSPPGQWIRAAAAAVDGPADRRTADGVTGVALCPLSETRGEGRRGKAKGGKLLLLLLLLLLFLLLVVVVVACRCWWKELRSPQRGGEFEAREAKKRAAKWEVGSGKRGLCSLFARLSLSFSFSSARLRSLTRLV